MQDISVSFFSNLSLASRTRRVPFPRTTRALLNSKIREAMRGSEFFACYQDVDGGVVAIDRQGVTVLV